MSTGERPRPGAERAPATVASMPTSIKDMLAIPFRRLWLFVMIVVVATGGTAIGVYVKPPEYTASASFLVHRERPPSVSDFGGSNWTLSRNEVIQTEIAILKSRSVIGRAVDQLDLTGYTPQAKGLKGIKQKLRRGLIASGLKNQVPDRDRWIRYVRANLNVKPHVQSQVIQMSINGPNPQLVTDIATALSSAYLERHAELYRQVGIYEFYEKQVQLSKDNLDTLRAEEERTRNELGVTSINEQLSLLVTRKQDVLEQLRQAELDRDEIREGIASLRSRSDNSAYSGPIAIPDGYGSLQALQARLAHLESERLAQSQRYRPDDPKMRSLSAQIGTVQASLLEKLVLTSRQIDTRIATLKAQDAEIDDQRQVLSQKTHSLEEFSLAVAAAEKTYIDYSQRLEEARLNSIGDSQLVNVSIIDEAQRPQAPERSRLSYITLALGLSVILGLGAAVVAELADPTIHTPSEARQRLELPVLAVLDAEPARRSRKLSKRSA